MAFQIHSFGKGSAHLRGLVIDLLAARTNQWTSPFRSLILWKGANASLSPLYKFVRTLQTRLDTEGDLLPYEFLTEECSRLSHHQASPTQPWAPATAWEPCPLGTLRGRSF